MKPLGKRILVKTIDETLNKTDGGIIIPESAKEKPFMGDVVAVSDEVKNIRCGDIVLFQRHSGVKLTIDKVDHLCLNEGEVLGVK